MVFEVLPKLMSSQVVLLSTGQLWRCQKALEGYFAYHHLLLHCLKAYPVLRAGLERMLDGFQTEPKARQKEHVHNIGEFLCLLSVSDKFGWDDLGVLILEEVFDRNVLWILKQAPHLGDVGITSVSDQARLRASFRANRVSLRLLMFQVAFLRLVKPSHMHDGSHLACSAASCALNRKDHCKGIPSPGEAEGLFDRCLEILAVDDFAGFLELVGAASMSNEEVCRWLRRSVLRSTEKGYHNPALFRALARRAAGTKQAAGGEGVDPEDFAVDNREKESKASKRARKSAGMLALAAVNARQAEYQRALSWARFHAPHGYRPRQCVTWAFGTADIEKILSAMGTDGILRERFNQALEGYRLLDGVHPDKLAKVKQFPVQVWLGLGCVDCGRALRCEISGRCMPCCRSAATQPMAAKPIKGLTAPDSPTANFNVFQAMAEMRPVQFEMHFEVPFDGLVADVKHLHAALTEDLTVKEHIHGGTIFTRVSRCGMKLWEKSPEQSIFPGSKLTAGWQGCTDAIFRAKVRNVNFVLLQNTIQNVTTLDDLGLLKMSRSFCKDHALETVVITAGLQGIDYMWLKTRHAVKSAFKDALKKVIATQIEIADLQYVDLALSVLEGQGVSVRVTVVPPTGMLPSAIVSKLSSRETLADAFVAAASAVEGVAPTSSPSISVHGVGLAKVVRVCPETLEDLDVVRACYQRPCQNCRGVLRLRFNAPARFAERRAQLEDLKWEELMKRAQLCGLADAASSNGASAEGRKTTVNLIIKSEGIIR